MIVFTLILFIVVFVTSIFAILGLLSAFPWYVIFIFPFSSFSTKNTYPSTVIFFVFSSKSSISPSVIIPLFIKCSIYSFTVRISPFFLAYKSTFSISNFSNISLILYCFPASLALFNIPCSPNVKLITIPAKISKIMIVITSDINVIPFLFLHSL